MFLASTISGDHPPQLLRIHHRDGHVYFNPYSLLNLRRALTNTYLRRVLGFVYNNDVTKSTVGKAKETEEKNQQMNLLVKRTGLRGPTVTLSRFKTAAAVWGSEQWRLETAGKQQLTGVEYWDAQQQHRVDA
nr:hypothetical protein Iba_chr07aCG13910 [Ipomoea batatas]